MRDLIRQEIAATSTIIVVKVGTQVLTQADGKLDEARIHSLAEQIHQVMQAGRKVVLVSSGAVGAGMGRLGLKTRPDDLASLQAVAAVGQSALIESYERALRKHGRHAAQILLTAEDMEHRLRYLNARNTLVKLLELGTVPIINENDTVAVEELQTTFGDNDHLAAMIANLILAPLLVLLSDVDGLYDGDPKLSGSKVIHTVDRLDENVRGLVRDKSSGISKGGMASKLEAARLATTGGGNVIIAHGRCDNILSQIIKGETIGTLFLAQGQLVAARKRWIGLTVKPRGRLLLDAGAREAVEKRGKSLLAIGVLEAEGNFNKGDVVSLRDADGKEFARGLTNYCADEVRRIKGLKTDQIAEALGCRPYDEIVHRDNMVVTTASKGLEIRD